MRQQTFSKFTPLRRSLNHEVCPWRQFQYLNPRFIPWWWDAGMYSNAGSVYSLHCFSSNVIGPLCGHEQKYSMRWAKTNHLCWISSQCILWWLHKSEAQWGALWSSKGSLHNEKQIKFSFLPPLGVNHHLLERNFST